jgi:hypothetical protein
MHSRQATSLYFATVCFLPLIATVLFPAISLGHLRVPSWIQTGLVFYIWTGVVLVIIKIWRSDWNSDRKGLWTVLILFLGLITLPIYWLRHIRKGAIPT